MLTLVGMGVLAGGCSTAAPPVSHAPARASSSPSASAAGGPCAPVTTTTPITDVPQACAELWAPYQVTEVPPPDILQQEHVPPAPRVVNRTNGAVSDAEAQRWADASNRGSGWFKWAEANDQPSLLLSLLGPRLVNSQEQEALSTGGHVDQPNCDLYPIKNALVPIGADGRTYFARNGFSLADKYVFVVVYDGPCSETITSGDGVRRVVEDFAKPTIVFVAGSFRSDPVLGGIWFADAGGGCEDPSGPPSDWCGR